MASPIAQAPIPLPPAHEQSGMVGDTSIFDENFERSLINLVSTEFRHAMLRCREAQPNYFLMNEKTLKQKCDPDSQTNRLKLKFWDEYNRAQSTGKNMNLSNVYKGVCSHEYFHQIVMPDVKMMAWIISPPRDYCVILRDMLEFGLDEEFEILKLSHITPTGKIDVRLITVKLKIIESLKLRVWGAVPIVNQNLNLNVGAPQAATIPPNASMDELLRIEGSLKKLNEGANGEIIDAEPVPTNPSTPSGS